MRHEGPGKVRLQTDPPRESDSSVWDGVLDALKKETGALSQNARTLVESHLSKAERDLVTLRTRVESDTELSDEQRSVLLGSSKTALVMMTRLRRNGLGAMAVGEGTALAVENAREAQRNFEKMFATHMQHATVSAESVETAAPAAPEPEASFEEVVDAAEARGADVARRAGIFQEEIIIDAVQDGKGTRRGTKGGSTRTRGQKKAKDTGTIPEQVSQAPVTSGYEIPKDALRDNQESPYLAQEGTDGFVAINASLSESGESTSPLQVGTRVEPATDSSFRPSSRYANRTASETVEPPQDTTEEPKTKREPWWTRKPKTVHYSDEMQSARDALKGYDPNQDDAPAISTTGNTNLRELFNKAPVDPLSPDTTAAEVRGALESAVEYEARRTADAFNLITEEALAKDKYEDTPERAIARLGGRVARERAENTYKQKDAEFAAVEAEKKAVYFAELTKFQQKRGFLDAMGERTGLKQTDQSKETADLKELKREWMRARLDRSRMRLDTVLERREARGASLSDEDREKKTLRADEVLERFQRRYLLREAATVAIKAAEEETQVRAEALSNRDRHVVEKVFKWTKDHPKTMLAISTLATGAGVLATAASLTVASPLAVLISAGAAVSAVNRIRAQGKADQATDLEKKGGANAETIAMIRAEQARLQRSAAKTTMAGLTSLLFGGAASKFFGKDKTQAEQEIVRARDTEIGDLRSDKALEALERISQDLDKAYAKIRQVDARVASASVVGGVVGGYGGGAAAGWVASQGPIPGAIDGAIDFGHDRIVDFISNDQAQAEAGADTTSSGEVDKVTTATEKQPATADTKTDTAPATKTEAVAADAKAPATTSGAEGKADVAAASAAKIETPSVGAADGPKIEGIAKPGVPEGLLVGATINSAGEGFGEMIVELKENFREQLGGTIDAPKPALEYVLSSNANAITQAIGAAENGQSLTMHMGDQFAIDENQNIWFQPINGEPHLVIENVPTTENPQGFVIHKLDTDGDMRVDGPVQAPELAAEAVPASSSAASDVVITQGNEDVTVGDVTVSQGTGLAGDSLSVSGQEQLIAAPIDSGEDIKPFVLPENLDTTVPAEAAQVESQKVPTEVQAQTEAPKTPAPAAETVPTQPAGVELVGTAHPFALPDAGPLMNENGVDLNKPQILMNEGRYWALGTSTEDSFDRASALSAELAKQPGAAADSSLTNVYFVARELNKLGVPYDVVKLVYTVPGSDPQTAGPEAPERMPGLPDASKFTLPAKR